MSAAEFLVLLLVAVLGHVMAAVWYVVVRYEWAGRMIYDLPVSKAQIRREMINSLHAPIHAVILAVFLWFGFFGNSTVASFVGSAVLTTVWAEIWHYLSHRAFHHPRLHWIHVEHHRSHLNTWLTAISFSFSEKLIFDLGLLAPLAILDRFLGLNFFGIAAWYVGYLIINSFSHANFELKPNQAGRWLGRVLTSTTYHSLHHSRYTGNYGLGTRILDRVCGTEWEDYERVFDRVFRERKPLRKLREKVPPLGAGE
jgi:sterol desaturase/sphingolipid hydroxylase (fatty acid hydroxylase superfamily)